MMSTDTELAIVFPGQGSQSVGMMDTLSITEPAIKQTFANASSILGYDLWQIITEGPQVELDSTEITQPALLTAAYATWEVWSSRTTISPAVLAGHSLGEYTALVCADVLAFEDALTLVAERGRCMQEAMPSGVGAMAAVLGLEDEQVHHICQTASGDATVAVANYNSPGQVVIAGHKQAVEKAILEAKVAGARMSVILPVSVPSHCSLMCDAADRFSTALDKIKFSDAKIPVIQNVDAGLRTDAKEIKAALVKQLYKPVQWVNSIRIMRKQNIKRIIECGPGKVLAGLVKRIERSLKIYNIHNRASLEKAINLVS